MQKVYIGIDNGVTGTIGIIDGENIDFFQIPVFSEQSYTKSKQNITRVNHLKLEEILKKYKEKNTIVVIERPMVNPTRFKSTMSALRCLEAVLIVVERLSLPRMYCDSKQWQKEMLPKNLKKDELKKASLDMAKRLFPKIDFSKVKDADGLLIAEWARRKNL